MTLEEALPLVLSLSAADKRRLIDALARELLEEHRRQAVAAKAASGTQPITLQHLDLGDEDTWTSWLESLLDTAGESIAGKQRELRALGIIDDAGELATGALPADMQPGSTTSVTTG